MSGVVIDTTTGLVYLASTSKPVLELFEQYFKTAFGGELERLYPAAVAASGSDHPLEDFMRELYTESMMLSLNGKDYHIAEQEKATLSGADGPSVSVTDAPDSARANLKSGLLLKSLKIRLSIIPEDELVSVFTLNADFSFSGLKTLRIKCEKGVYDPDASFLLKMDTSKRPSRSCTPSSGGNSAEGSNDDFRGSHNRAYPEELLQRLHFPVHLQRIGRLSSFTLPALSASASMVRATPVVSYLCLRGRCSYCGVRISLQSP